MQIVPCLLAQSLSISKLLVSSFPLLLPPLLPIRTFMHRGEAEVSLSLGEWNAMGTSLSMPEKTGIPFFLYLLYTGVYHFTFPVQEHGNLSSTDGSGRISLGESKQK